MSAELLFALDELEKEKGIDKEVIISAIEEALNASYGKSETECNTRVEFNRETGEIKVYAQKEVVEVVENDTAELSLAEAREIDPEFEIGDFAEFEITPKNFGRLAAQKAKQIIIQKLREEERTRVYDQFRAKEKDIVTGTIQRIEMRETKEGKKERIIHVDLGQIEGILLPAEQVETEQYKVYDRIKAYVLEVKDKGFKSKEPCVMISRSHPNLVKRLFEIEVPEIHDGIVEIMNIAREPGSRTKISVYSKDENVEPVGACVGQKGTRVQVIVDELRGERIDIIKWSPYADDLIASSLSPAKALRVFINEEDKSATAIVPDSQLSLAIGREGQNVRLAAKLTSWKIDIKSEAQIRASVEEELFGEDDGEAADTESVDEAINPYDENGAFDPNLV
ncbi:MAG: transcription termination/antitermination protein NusA [Ruminococcaceae bacterium]|nr:transcription termination/antitermination protein NusA [Oscillospiraceae bacterium]